MDEFIFDHVLVIGNGFDLDLGLPTSYGDFLGSDEFIKLPAKRNKLAIHLSKVHQTQKWVDIENELISLSSTNSLDPLRENSPDYLGEFKALREALVLYIKKIDYSNLNKKSIAYQLLSELSKNSSLCIIDFNYTESVPALLKELGSSATHIRVHGTAAGGKIVFGVHDQAEIKNEHVFLKKAVSSALYTEHFAGEFMKYASESVSVFGHSLGNTDFTQFLPFFDLRQHKQESKLDLYYHNETSYYDLYRNMDLLTSNQLQRFALQHQFEMIGPELSDV